MFNHGRNESKIISVKLFQCQLCLLLYSQNVSKLLCQLLVIDLSVLALQHVVVVITRGSLNTLLILCLSLNSFFVMMIMLMVCWGVCKHVCLSAYWTKAM